MQEEFDSIFPEYIYWMHTGVNGQLSENHPPEGITPLSCARQVFGAAILEFWVYHADGGKECVAKGHGNFD